jgi:predicted phosphodiesterase
MDKSTTSTTSRRKFLAGAPLLATALATSSCTEKKDTRQKIKFSLFADLHHKEFKFHWVEERLEQILKRAEDNNVDFMIHLGDFCSNVDTAKDLINRYNNFKVPTYHVVGNHDFQIMRNFSRVKKAFKMEESHYTVDMGVFRLIVLDANYFKDENGNFKHYSSKSHKEAYKSYTGTYITPPQIEMLAEALRTAKGPCMIFSHHGIRLDRPQAGITNTKEILEVIEKNRRTPIMWSVGHYHRNHLRLDNGIAYFMVNSTTWDWLGGKMHNGYPDEVVKKGPEQLVRRICIYDKPVHAIVTVWEDGEIKIEGMKGGPFLGKTPEMLGSSSYKDNFPSDQSVLSAHFKLFNAIKES